MITHVLRTLWQIERQSVIAHAERCCHNRHRLSGCTRCVDACPAGALTLDDGLQIDLERCRDCGTCATVCPSGALEMRGTNNVQLLAEVQRVVAGGSVPIFACTRNAPPGGHPQKGLIWVPCLGRLDESILVGAVALGARAVVLIERDCGNCRYARGAQVAQDVAARSNRLLQMAGRAPVITLVHEGALDSLPAAAPIREPGSADGVSRRSLFQHLLRDSAHVSCDAITQALRVEEPPQPQVEKGRLPVALPAHRALLLQALQRLGLPEEGESDGEGLWARVAVSERCDACGMCAHFCPTGALQKLQGEGTRGLAFTIARCVDCHLCIDCCHRHAISHSHRIPLQALIDERPLLLVERKMPRLANPADDRRLEAAIRNTLGL